MDKKSFFHDHGYKYLFSNPTLVRYLITGFVKEEWVKDVDFTRMEKLDKEFISEEYQKRESDIIYKVRYQGSEAYIFLLIEFQSTVDRFMALRVLHYICKLYLDILERNKYTTNFGKRYNLRIFNTLRLIIGPSLCPTLNVDIYQFHIILFILMEVITSLFNTITNSHQR